MPDLSDYTPDPIPICAPGHHQLTYYPADHSWDEDCRVCGLNLADSDQEQAWHLDQIVNNPPSVNEENP